MTGRPSTFIHGAALSTGWADARFSLMDLIFQTVSRALTDAGVSMDRIDSVVLASHDLIDGRSLSSMVTAPAAGAYMRDEVRLADDGLAAASLATARIEAGEAGYSLVAAWGRASEGAPDRVGRAAFDPALLQPLGLTEADVSGLRLSAWLGRYPGQAAARAAAAAARQARAGRNPRTVAGPTRDIRVNLPLHPQEGPVWADIVAAAVLGPAKGPVKIIGVGHSADLPMPGDRDLLAMPSLAQAAARACAAAGRSLSAIDVIELDGMTLSDEALGSEAIGLVPAGAGFTAYAESDRVNPSGGGACGWCYPAMGLVRMVEAWLQLTGRAGAVQRSAPVRTGLATGAAPIGAQTHTAMVLEAV